MTAESADTPVAAAAASPASAKRLIDAWQDLKMNFAVHMGAFRPEQAWLDRLEAHSERMRTLLAQDTDLALYMLQQTACSEIEHYSAHHAMFCAVVRHHDPAGGRPPDDMPSDNERLAELLHRVDVFTAKLSRRQTRAGASATVAARDACLDASGHPDAIGATVLRVLGLYPPGSCVRLVNGELAIVTHRGTKAHAPVVAALRRADCTPFIRPARRDTSDKAFAVQRAVGATELKMVINHERTLSA